jgi:transmembrane sensor
LLQGEVSFEVAKDTDRPFQVLAGGGIVQAVGTEFSVHLTASNEVDVIVVEGRVAVMRETRTQLAERTSDFDKLPPLRLDAGEGVRYGNGVDSINRMKFDEKTLDKKLAWKRGVLIFKGETLEQAIEQISRYTTNNIVIDDPSLASMQVGGRYKTNDIDTLIQSLAEVMEIDLHYLPGGKVILKKSNG